MIINIGRQLGAGGRYIGELIAHSLGLKYYDKELITVAAQQSGIAPEFFEHADEVPTRFGSEGFLGNLIPFWNSTYYNTGINNHQLFKIQSDVIRELAQAQGSVFVGRCADYILRDRTDCLNIFLTANKADRIQRMMGRMQLTEKEATKLIDHTDEQRAAYYQFYTDKTWGDSKSYDICINTSMLGLDETAQAIILIIQKHFTTI